jgi:hypothetical protein
MVDVWLALARWYDWEWNDRTGICSIRKDNHYFSPLTLSKESQLAFGRKSSSRKEKVCLNVVD